MLITASHDKGIKIFQLPLYWPSELVRKYKSKNNKKILLANTNYKNEEKDSNNEFEKSSEKLENEENPFVEKTENIINQEANKKNENIKNKEDANENKEDANIEATEDDDFLILKSVAKLKHELSEHEKNCEDLHGWDEDF